MTCNHPAVLFYKENLYFKCEKCGEIVMRVFDIKDFFGFCKIIGKDPEKIMA